MKTKFLILLAAIALLVACKQKSAKDYEFVNNGKSTSAAADSAKYTELTRAIADTNKMPVEKLVKTADITIKVKDVHHTGEDIAVLTKQYGGMVMHHQVQSTSGAARDVHISNDSLMRIAAVNTTGDMLVKIPSDKLEDFMTKVSHMGIYINLSRMDVEDKSFDYLSNQLKLKDREELVSQQKSGKIRIKNPTDVLLLKDDMVDQKITNLRTDAAVEFSTLSLSFYQSDTILKEMVANDDPSAYNIPLLQRFGLAFSNGWAAFVDVAIGLVNFWMFIVVGIAIWRAVIYYKKRGRFAKPATA